MIPAVVTTKVRVTALSRITYIISFAIHFIYILVSSFSLLQNLVRISG